MINKYKFEGRKKYVYDLVERNKNLVNRLVLMRQSDEEVIDNFSRNFNAEKRLLKLYLNDELIYDFNKREITEQKLSRILEVDTGIIFQSIADFADAFDITLSEAKLMVKRKHNYKWIK